jgi:hypothetical protein
VLLDATLRLSETQLLAQISDETSLDGRIMGLLAFNGALLAADVAAKDVLGRLWWTVLPFLALSALFCLRSAFAKSTDLGPSARDFYASYGGIPAVAARKQLLADLDESFATNATRVAEKAADLRRALGILTLGLIIATLLISFVRPSKVPSHENCSSSASTVRASTCAHSTKTSADAGTIRSPQSRAGRDHPRLVE